MPTQRNRLAPSPIEDNPVGWSSIYAPPPGRVVENASPEFSPLAPSTYMTAAQKVGRFFNAATGRAKPYTVADLLGLTQAGNEAYDAAAGFVNSTNPIRAYHGSPHTFDRFDLSKIGTGEGAQAYGHGLYFAGNEGVARGYKNTLSGGKLLTKDGALLDADGLAGAEGIAARFLASHGGDFAEALKEASRFNDPAAMRAAFAKLEAAGAKPAPGSMYEVNLRTSPERLLDWDKPLSQQPAILQKFEDYIKNSGARNSGATAAVDNSGISVGKSPAGAPDPLSGHQFGALRTQSGFLARVEGPNGQRIYRDQTFPTREAVTEAGKIRLLETLAKPKTAQESEFLKSIGIDGIQYLDAGSRAAGEGSRNYVMFRDDIIDILKRYGLLGMIGGGAATGNRLAPQGEQ